MQNCTFVRNTSNITCFDNQSSDNYDPNVLTLVIAWLTVFSFVATLLFNGVHLVVYFKNSSLRTPFNSYVANICMTEVLSALTAIPKSFIHTYYGNWPFDVTSCNFMAYASQLIGSAIRYGHVLITCNRIWAVTFPISYKQRHTAGAARTFIITIWVYLHILHLPVVIPGRVWPQEGGDCYVNTSFQFASALTVELLGFLFPELFVICSYPYIAYKVKNGRKKIGTQLKHSAAGDEGKRDQSNSLHGASVSRAKENEQREVQAKRRSHNRIFHFLVVAMFLCWTPNEVYYLLGDFIGFKNSIFHAFQYVLIYAHSWITPVIFYITMKKFGLAINALVPGCLLAASSK